MKTWSITGSFPDELPSMISFTSTESVFLGGFGYLLAIIGFLVGDAPGAGSGLHGEKGMRWGTGVVLLDKDVAPGVCLELSLLNDDSNGPLGRSVGSLVASGAGHALEK